MTILPSPAQHTTQQTSPGLLNHSGAHNPAAYTQFDVKTQKLTPGGMYVLTPYGQGVLESWSGVMVTVRLACGARMSIQRSKVQFHTQHDLNSGANQQLLSSARADQRRSDMDVDMTSEPRNTCKRSIYECSETDNFSDDLLLQPRGTKRRM
ncbi:unnamed protein product [Amoebophrya sp. A120]|nr:unnamed protein product [Amoebophrya sp. A120]|eukprot:GSA120T00012184001.1